MGAGLWVPCAVPSVGVLCSRAWWEASSESPWVFGDASHLHDLKRPSLFRRDKVPGTKHQQTVRLRLYTLKEVFGGSKGRFFKNAPWQGVGRSPTKGEGKPVCGVRPFRWDKVPGTKHQQTVRLRLYTLKEVFGGSKGRFFKNAPWQGVGRSPTESRQQEKGRFTVQTPERTSLFRRFLPDSATRRPPWRQAHPVFGFR